MMGIAWRRTVLALSVPLVLLLALWLLVESQIRASSLLIGVHPQIIAALEASLADQKALALQQPERESELHARFRRTEELLAATRILALHREALLRRLRTVIFLLAALGAVAVTAWDRLRRRREAGRLARLGWQIDAVARGEPPGPAWPPGETDLIARIGRLVTAAGERLHAYRQRARFLEHLEIWQRGARHLSHELKSPLMSIRLGVDRLRRRADSEHAEILDRIDRELGRLERDLGAFSSIVRLAPPELAPLDLEELAQRFVETFAEAWSELDLEHRPGFRTLPVLADAGQLRQVLINLCENSQRAALRCGRRLAVSLAASRQGSIAALEVTDDGPGLSPAVALRLFEPFVTESREQGGSGLGLTISRRIALEHGGDLEHLPNGRGGCAFRLTLPLAEER